MNEANLSIEEFWARSRSHLGNVLEDLSYNCKIGKIINQRNFLQDMKFYIRFVDKADYEQIRKLVTALPLGKKIVEKLKTAEEFYAIIPNVDRLYILELIENEDALGLENYVLFQNPKFLLDLEEMFNLNIGIFYTLEKQGIQFNVEKLRKAMQPLLQDLEKEIQVDNDKIAELENKIYCLEKTIAHQYDRIRGLLDDVQDLRTDNEKHMRLHDLVDALKDKLDHIPTNDELSVQNLYERLAYRTPPHKYKGKEVWVDLLTGTLYDLTPYTVDRDKKGKPNPKRRRFYIHNKYKQAIVDMLKKAS